MIKSFAIALGGSYLAYNQRKTLVKNENQSQTRNAICILYPHRDSRVFGLVSFQQENITSKTKITVNVKNLKPNSLHGFHVHEFGVLINNLFFSSFIVIEIIVIEISNIIKKYYYYYFLYINIYILLLNMLGSDRGLYLGWAAL